MGRTIDHIDDAAAEFIRAQHMFFVATAPRSDAGHINLSPKGLDTFRVLSPTLVAYADYTGSGVETISHIRENGRITIMFCAFEGKANILRIYGRGRIVEAGASEFESLVQRVSPPSRDGLRAVIALNVSRVMDSCGWGVPLFTYGGERDQLIDWGRKKGHDGLREYQRNKNAVSIDGLPGLESAQSK